MSGPGGGPKNGPAATCGPAPMCGLAAGGGPAGGPENAPAAMCGPAAMGGPASGPKNPPALMCGPVCICGSAGRCTFANGGKRLVELPMFARGVCVKGIKATASLVGEGKVGGVEAALGGLDKEEETCWSPIAAASALKASR